MPHQSLVRNKYKQKINPSRSNPRRREKIKNQTSISILVCEMYGQEELNVIGLIQDVVIISSFIFKSKHVLCMKRLCILLCNPY